MKELDDFYTKANIMLDKSFDLSESQKTRIINRYVNAIKDELHSKEFKFYRNTDKFFVSLKNIGSKSRAMINKRQREMHTWFMDYCPLFKIVTKGSNIDKRFTEISLYYKIDTLIDTLYNSTVNNEDFDQKTALEMLYGEEHFAVLANGDDSKVDFTPVDLQSLRAYIENTETYIQNQRQYLKSTKSLEKRVRQAKRIYAIAHICNGEIIQIKSHSEFGRQFYQGPNLLTCHKDVRHAALGECVEYDINNSVYAWRLHEAKKIVKKHNAKIQFPCTVDYMDRKDYIRLTIARDVYGRDGISDPFKQKLIKQAFTAIGFGAQGSAEPVFWYDRLERKTLALNDIIRNPVERKAFMEHPFIDEFIQEQHLISKLIYKEYKDDFKDVKVLLNSNGEVSEAKFIAFLYQHTETIVLNDALSHILKQNLLLRCHDAFYLRKVNVDDVKEIKYKLAKAIPGLTLEKIEIQPWVKIDKRFKQELNDAEMEHRRLIAQEEQRAKEYIMQNAENVIQLRPPKTDEELLAEQKRKDEKELEDLLEYNRKKEELDKWLAQRLGHSLD